MRRASVVFCLSAAIVTAAAADTQATAQAVWSATPRLTATVTATHFRAGAFLRQTPPGDDVLHTTTFITCRF